MDSNERIKRVDAIRGYAAFLVVLAHALQFEYGLDNRVLSSIRSFFMPLFFVISGYCCYRHNNYNDYAWLKGRAKRLMVPFIITYIISSWNIYGIEYTKWIKRIYDIMTISPDKGGYWFLFTLFELCVCLYVCNTILGKLNIEYLSIVAYLLIVVIFNICFWKFHINYLGMYLLSWHSFFFFLGYHIHKFSILNRLDKIVNNNIVWFFTMLIAGIMLPSCDKDGVSSYIYKLNTLLHNHYLQNLFGILMRYFIPLLGCMVSYIVIKLLPAIIINKLAYIGMYTIEIYIISNYWFMNYTINSIVNVCINTIFSLILSITVANIIESGYLSILLFGKPTVIHSHKK